MTDDQFYEACDAVSDDARKPESILADRLWEIFDLGGMSGQSNFRLDSDAHRDKAAKIIAALCSMRSEAEVRDELESVEFYLRSSYATDTRRPKWEIHRDALKWVLREEG